MRVPLDLQTTKPPGMSTEQWVSEQLTKIVEASQEDAAVFAADAFTITNITETKSLDCDAATLDEVRKALGTLIRFIQQRAPQRSE